jgi:hypothetical protein
MEVWNRPREKSSQEPVSTNKPGYGTTSLSPQLAGSKIGGSLPNTARHAARPHWKIIKAEGAVGVAQVAEHLSSTCNTLSSNPSATEKRWVGERERENWMRELVTKQDGSETSAWMVADAKHSKLQWDLMTVPLLVQVWNDWDTGQRKHIKGSICPFGWP